MNNHGFKSGLVFLSTFFYKFMSGLDFLLLFSSMNLFVIFCDPEQVKQKLIYIKSYLSPSINQDISNYLRLRLDNFNKLLERYNLDEKIRLIENYIRDTSTSILKLVPSLYNLIMFINNMMIAQKDREINIVNNQDPELNLEPEQPINPDISISDTSNMNMNNNLNNPNSNPSMLASILNTPLPPPTEEDIKIMNMFMSSLLKNAPKKKY